MRNFQAGIFSRLVIHVVAVSGNALAQPQSAASELNLRDRTTPQRPLKSSEASRESLEEAVTSPLRDANLVKSDIPPVLLQAVANPYARSGQRSCATLRKEVVGLNQVLGDDFDESEGNRPSDDRKGVYGVDASIVSDGIPMRSWIRKLSSAERRDGHVQDAIAAGIARRSYLKGIGRARGCKPPASPRTIFSTPPAEKP